jgi:5-bromo-4-chloroindolyl phosphate hydrolysis protein
MAEKLQLGRNTSETIGEWFKRVGVNEDSYIQTVYERVRYGNQFESDEEYRLFLKNIDAKKNELKQIHKLLVEEGKINSTSRVKNIIKGFKSRTEEQ